MKKITLNYWVDLVTGAALVLSALSGVVLLLPVDPVAGFPGVRPAAWSGLHTLTSLLVAAGVGIHLLLHARWMVNMTGRILPLLLTSLMGNAMIRMIRVQQESDFQQGTGDDCSNRTTAPRG